QGYGGQDHLQASMESGSIDLYLTAQKPPAIHNRTGLFPFADLGWTYYYSRTRLKISGTLTVAKTAVPVDGIAWFDHQWGDFDPTLNGSGWDWFSAQFDDDTELMLFVIRRQDGNVSQAFGTFVDAGGKTTDLAQDEIATEATGSWTSPATGIAYPSG